MFRGPNLKSEFEASVEGPGEAYTINGKDPGNQFEYSIHYKKVGSHEYLVTLRFRIDSNLRAGVSFEIITLADDLIKGSMIETFPHNKRDSVIIPVNPQTPENRFLLRNKDTIKLRGPSIGIEISDLNDNKSISVADFRQVDWARNKGVYFYGGKSLLIPGKSYDFLYRIRTFKTDRTLSSQKPLPVQKIVSDPHALLAKLPKHISPVPGRFSIHTKMAIYGNPSGTAELVLQRELFDNYRTASSISSLPKNSRTKGIHIESIPAGVSSLPPEGFSITVKKDRIDIVGGDDRGCLYGVWALLELISLNNGEPSIACGIIRDWPDIPLRGLCMNSDFVPTGNKDVSLYKRYLDAVSRSRGNFVVFYHKPIEVQSWAKKETSQKFWSEEEMREIAAYARFLKLDIWTGMNSKFNKKTFPELEIVNGTNIYNPMDDRSYRFLFSLYRKLIDLYQPSHFIIGHDEIKGLNLYAEKYRISPAEILFQDIQRFHDWLSARRIKTAIWGDMFLSNQAWERDAPPANSENKLLNSGATHQSLDNLPRDIVMLDWHYLLKSKYKSIGFFHEKGFDVIGTSYHSPKAACSMAKSVRAMGANGMMATNWGFWRTLSPAATTLYALLCAWSSDLSPGNADEDVALLGSLLRPQKRLRWRKQAPIPLDAVFDNAPENSVGSLEIGPAIDLQSLPTGLHRFGAVQAVLPEPRQMRSLVLCSADTEKACKRSITIPLNPPVRADAIAFFHTLFAEEPSVQLTKVGHYTIKYTDGRIERVGLISGWNITDIRSNPGIRRNPWPFSVRPDILLGSEIAWVGQSLQGIPLNIQKFVVTNPFAATPISSIHVSLKGNLFRSKFLLIGITALEH